MKKIVTVLLILSILCAVPLAFGSCRKRVQYETWDASKYTETIDLSKYSLVFEDEFEGERNRDIWGDTRQGTRRTGFWTKNLAYTDGEGHLVIRTEKRGSRYCSSTFTREVEGYNGSRVKVTYDDCMPFGIIAGDFGNIADIHAHTEDLVGDVILSTFDELGVSFDGFLSAFEIPEEGSTYIPETTEAMLESYKSFYDTAMLLFNYYSFVVDTKTVSTPLSRSALVGINRPYAMAFGADVDPHVVEYAETVAHLFGFASATELRTYAQTLADTYATYRLLLANGGETEDALENGCFRSSDGSFIFPVAVHNETNIVLTYVIVDATGVVSVWLIDITAALTATNASASYYAGDTVNNATYCKNTLFVTGPEGVYSGAIRTLDKYMHSYGYYEIRCKLPDVVGIWHAFWLMCGNVYSEENGSADGVEIDVFEYLPARDAINVALHWDGYDEAHQNIYKRFDKTGFGDDEYHTFGVNWDENGYAFYIEGRKVWETTGDGICPLDGYMIISTEYGEWGDWVAGLDINDIPVDWLVDRVRVYEKNLQ